MDLPEADSDFWAQLIYLIDEGEVIPIIGQELLTFTVDGKETSFPQLVAVKLATQLKLDYRECIADGRLSENFSVSDVVSMHPVFRSDRGLIYKKIHAAYTEVKAGLAAAGTTIPEPLRLLAGIRSFRIFVTTTYDDLLESALNAAWYGGESGAVVRAYAPLKPADLAEEDFDPHAPPVVFKLCGEITADAKDQYYAATDADMVEFLHGLQFDKRPNRLFDALSKHHLLILGTNFPNWLARFFLRVVKNAVLWTNREKNEYLADEQLQREPALVRFIEQFSKNTTCLQKATPAEFVEKLHAAWILAHAGDSPAAVLPPPGEPVLDAASCVFVSYASENATEAKRVKAMLQSMGWPVWLDKKDLEIGDEYGKKIERTIKSAAACVILLSSVTNGNEPRFFRREWAWAQERAKDFTGLARGFIHPLRLTPEANIPPDLDHLDAKLMLNDEFPLDFIEKMKNILRQVRKEQQK